MLKLKFIYNRKSKLNDQGEALVQLRIYTNGLEKYRFLSTDIYIKPNQWSKKNESIKNHPLAIDLNLELSNLKVEIQKIFLDLKRVSGTPSAESLIYAYKAKENSSNFITFVYDQIENDRNISPGTSTRYKYLPYYLERFSPGLHYSHITINHINKFSRWLSDKGHHDNYVNSILKIYKKYVRVLISQGLISRNPFDTVTIKNKRGKHTFLSIHEVELFYQVDIGDLRGKIHKVKDAFLFACYTGLRISDLMDLRPNHIYDTPEGLRVKKLPIKTRNNPNTEIDLPLYMFFNGRPQEIIKLHIEDKDSNDRIFGPINDALYNKYIRLIAQRAGINKHLTSHVARHTFGTQMVNLGFRLETIAKYMGHTDVSTTQIYAKLSTAAADDEAGNIFNDK